MKISCEIDTLKDKLSHFLTLEQNEVSKLLKDHSENEVLSLYRNLEEMRSYYRNWADTANLRISYDDWQGDKRLPLPDNKARLHSILREELKLNANEINTSKIKAKLHSLLDRGVSSSHKILYDLSHKKVHILDQEEQLSEYDIFKRLLIYVLLRFGDKLANFEKDWIEDNPDYNGKHLPNDVFKNIEHHVIEKTYKEIDMGIVNHLSKLIDENNTLTPPIGNCLQKMLSDNLVANEMINELEALNNRTREAQEIATDLITNLEMENISGIPEEFLSANLEEGSDLIEKYLKYWFGAKGILLNEKYFKNSRPISGSQIKLILKWSKKAQQEYLKTKGYYCQSTHEHPESLFIFSLGLVGAFYSKSTILKENTGTSNSHRSVFPGNLGQENPPPHTLAILIEFYSQVYYGSTDYKFNIENILDHGKVSIEKRATQQKLIFKIVKHRPSKELLALRFYLAEFMEISKME